MIDRRHVVLETALDRFRRVEGKLYRYPAVDPALQRRRVEEVLGGG
jgi:hypothetical protein